jgi:hypothetical protein
LALQTEINVVWQKFINELSIKPPPNSFFSSIPHQA